MFGDRPQGLLGVEGQLWDQGGAGLQAGQDPGLVAEVVEERVDAEVAVVAGDLAAGRPRGRPGQRLPVRAQHAFAAAGGAGGEQDVGQVVGSDRGRSRVGRRQVGPRADKLVPRSVVRLDRHSHDVPQIGQRRAVEVGRPVCAEELAHRHQQGSAGSGQDVGGFGRRVAGVQRHHDRAGVVRGQAGDHPVPGIRRPDRHPVAGVHAEADHRGCGATHLVA